MHKRFLPLPLLQNHVIGNVNILEKSENAFMKHWKAVMHALSYIEAYAAGTLSALRSEAKSIEVTMNFDERSEKFLPGNSFTCTCTSVFYLYLCVFSCRLHPKRIRTHDLACARPPN